MVGASSVPDAGLDAAGRGRFCEAGPGAAAGRGSGEGVVKTVTTGSSLRAPGDAGARPQAPTAGMVCKGA